MSRHTVRGPGSEGCVECADGTVSAYPLHEQILEGVDDSDFRAGTRGKLLEGGRKPEQIDRLFGDLPPSAPLNRKPE